MKKIYIIVYTITTVVSSSWTDIRGDVYYHLPKVKKEKKELITTRREAIKTIKDKHKLISVDSFYLKGI